MASVDVAVADVLADDGVVLGLYQTVVVGVAGLAFGLLDAQLVEQAGHGLLRNSLQLSEWKPGMRKGN